MKSAKKLSIMALALVTTTVVAGTASAETPDLESGHIDQLIEARQLMENGQVEEARAIFEEIGIRHPRGKRLQHKMKNLSEEDRERLKEAKELFQAGDEEAAKAIFEELGVHPEKLRKMRRHHVNSEMHEQIQAAFEAGDYKAWLEIAGDNPIAEQVTSENFGRFAEAHELGKAGDREGARAIFEELGFERPERPEGFKEQQGKFRGEFAKRMRGEEQ